MSSSSPNSVPACVGMVHPALQPVMVVDHVPAASLDVRSCRPCTPQWLQKKSEPSGTAVRAWVRGEEGYTQGLSRWQPERRRPVWWGALGNKMLVMSTYSQSVVGTQHSATTGTVAQHPV
jgi:hypothetical protein